MKHVTFPRPLLPLLFILTAGMVHGQIAVESSIDWDTGIFELRATMPLAEGQSPDDHPRALEELERSLPPYAVSELGRISWDNRGTLEDLMERDPARRTSVEALAAAMERQWSRISSDFNALEALYVLDIAASLPSAFPASRVFIPPAVPIGWHPVPDDGWTGIVIYLPGQLPLRGTGMESEPRPALMARILSDDLTVLADPSAAGGLIRAYYALDDRENAESMVGRRPYRTMARGLYGESSCDIILSAEDSRRILAAESSRRALSEGRVAILLDALP